MYWPSRRRFARSSERGVHINLWGLTSFPVDGGARSSTSAVHPIREHVPLNRLNPAAPISRSDRLWNAGRIDDALAAFAVCTVS